MTNRKRRRGEQRWVILESYRERERERDAKCPTLNHLRDGLSNEHESHMYETSCVSAFSNKYQANKPKKRETDYEKRSSYFSIVIKYSSNESKKYRISLGERNLN